MKFLVALSCLLAVASAAVTPVAYSNLAAPITYSNIAYSGVAAPVAYSSVHSSSAVATPVAHTIAHVANPVVAQTYAAPFVGQTYAAAAPVVAQTYAAAPVAVADVAAAPVATVAAAPVVAAPVTTVAAAPVVAAGVEKTQYHAQDDLGQASYGHSEAFQTHNAVQDAAGNKVGSFSYVAPNGQVFATNYVADGLGYRVATNAVPAGPAAVPVAPADTPEVVAARAAHFNAHALARSRSRRSVIAAPIVPTAAYTSGYHGYAYSAPAYYSAAAVAPVVNHAVAYHVY